MEDFYRLVSSKLSGKKLDGVYYNENVKSRREDTTIVPQNRQQNHKTSPGLLSRPDPYLLIHRKTPLSNQPGPKCLPTFHKKAYVKKLELFPISNQ